MLFLFVTVKCLGEPNYSETRLLLPYVKKTIMLCYRLSFLDKTVTLYKHYVKLLVIPLIYVVLV